MSVKTAKYVHLISGCLLSVLTVIVGVLFYAQIIDIYVTGTHTGGTMYSPEIVAEHFGRISPAFWLWIAMIIAVFVLQEVFPLSKKTSYKDNRYALKRLKAKCANGIEGLEESYAQIKREERTVKILWLCCGIIILAGVIYGIVYLAMPQNFPQDNVNGGMLSMVKHFAPFVGTAFLTCIIAAIYEGVSAKKQMPAAKEIVAKSKGLLTKPQTLYEKLRAKIKNGTFLAVYDFIYIHRIGIARIAVAVVAITFTIVGIFNGSMADVLKKAINICTECIGLG